MGNDAAVIMAKALKTKEPTVFKGEEVYLKPLTYMEDLMLSGIMAETEAQLASAGIEDPTVKMSMSNMSYLMGAIKYILYNKDGSPYFKSMSDVYEFIKTPGAVDEITKLHTIYLNTLELTKEEKKS